MRKDLETLFLLDITLMAPSSKSLSDTSSISRELDPTVYDAAYVQLAEELRANLVTADEEICAELKGSRKYRLASLLSEYSMNEEQR